MAITGHDIDLEQRNFFRLDVIIVLGAVVDEIVTRSGASSNAGAVKALRILRGLRPLRTIRHLHALRVLTAGLMSSAKPLLTVAVVAIAVFCILAVLGMQILSGTMQRCSDPLVGSTCLGMVEKSLRSKELPASHIALSGQIFSRYGCEGQARNGSLRIWENSFYGFDWIGESFLTVFVISSLEFEWNLFMYEAVDHSGKYVFEQTDREVCGGLCCGFADVSLLIYVIAS